MFEGACHCGRIRFSVAEPPRWLTSCNCSLCRRVRGLWAHYPVEAVTLTCDGETVRYVQGDRTLETISCAGCGCTTHWSPLSEAAAGRMAVNFAMCEPDAVAHLRVRRFDGADTWEFLD